MSNTIHVAGVNVSHNAKNKKLFAQINARIADNAWLPAVSLGKIKIKGQKACIIFLIPEMRMGI
jgi:hypothetical protein